MTDTEDLLNRLGQLERYIRTTVTTDPVERWWLDTVRIFLASLRSKDARIKELERPITMQDVRLAVGEGPLKPADVLAGCNAELRRRSTLNPETAPSPDSKP